MAKQSKEDKRIDKLIDQAYRESCSGIQIDIFDISKVFAEGRKAIAEGRDLHSALKTLVETIRKN